MGTCFEPSRRLRRHETSTSGFGRARPRLEEENDKYPVSKIIWMRGPSPHPQDRRARRDRLQKCFIGWHRIRTGIGMALPRDSIYLSVVPATWTNEDDVFDRPSTNILEELVAFLDENAHDSMVVIDSITDLAVSDIVEIKDLVTTIKGLQRVAKRWNGLVYLMLTRGILERRHESLLMDSTDGCLVFEWRTSARSSTRQRYMYLEKFTGVLPHLPRDKIARFPTMVSSNHGLVVVYMERIS